MIMKMQAIDLRFIFIDMPYSMSGIYIWIIHNHGSHCCNGIRYLSLSPFPPYNNYKWQRQGKACILFVISNIHKRFQKFWIETPYMNSILVTKKTAVSIVGWNQQHCLLQMIVLLLLLNKKKRQIFLLFFSPNENAVVSIFSKEIRHFGHYARWTVSIQ